jgi:hypothetical protein
MKPQAKISVAVRVVLVVLTALALAAPSASHAQGCLPGDVAGPAGVPLPVQCGDPKTPDPCDPRQGGGHGGPEQGDGDLCAKPIFGASCVAIGLYLKVEPNPALPTGATTQLSRSEAMAAGFNGFGFGHADAHQVRQDLPGTLGAGAVESKCDVNASAQQDFKYTFAHGRADTAQVALDLMPNYGVPLNLQFDVLCEEGASNNTAPGFLYDPCVPSPPGDPGASLYGANRADVANLIVNGTPLVSVAAAPNTWIPLPPAVVPGLAGDLYLNEQWPGVPTPFSPCVRWDGDALRLVLRNPVTGATVATLIMSWVSTCTA